jgi:hypothetical protein
MDAEAERNSRRTAAAERGNTGEMQGARKFLTSPPGSQEWLPPYAGRRMRARQGREFRLKS